MTRPHDFGFDETAQILKDTARRLLQDHCSPEQLHRLVAASSEPARASECVWDEALWRRMLDLGWTAVAVPEALGGFGMGLVAIAGLVEEIGRAAVPSPLIATLCATYVAAACDSDGARKLLRQIASGLSVSLAIIDRRGSWEAGDCDVTASDAGVLNGTAWFVQDARKVGVLLVKARSSRGVGLYAVDVDAAGVTIVPDAIVDLTRDQAHVELRDVAVPAERIIALPGDGARALAAAEPAILTILAADMVGAAEWQLQTTAEYARTRVQFERPIGFFQAVKHPLVDMMVKIDAARSLLYDAASAFDHEPDAAEVCARMAKSAASDAASYCSGRSVQLHGGIGFTWECFVQLWFKRQKHNEVLFGDAAHQRARLADRLLGRIGETA
ncbi:acyl-CoA dehydrogenase family protein [Nannocystis radixulma]|uniref:Acyl-CoA/acyl-ACP dehydrogenase n=1 Tax=Nannocystis radixulma TaxID=2995305 RepID=A0ABT5B2M6_9BACT|nr:acyl-CoA dehydrogenase family protein [Nannocystis radixulma]MDC0668364.1 acyl-CoA/acyl-ACP dehydrogenase [Nannocystis radixulma]